MKKAYIRPEIVQFCYGNDELLAGSLKHQIGTEEYGKETTEYSGEGNGTYAKPHRFNAWETWD